MNALDYKIEEVSAQCLADWKAPQLSRETARLTVVNALKKGFEGDVYEDLITLFHNFNHLTCFYSIAEAMLYQYNIFDAIADVVEYEQRRFDKIYTNLANSYQIAESLWRILGENVLYGQPEIREFLELPITDENTQALLIALGEIAEVAI
ncbi:hypothetical protein NHG29_03225 [Aerococcaceae bacterium NML160702]|nr:hypothetical protein [Aerococcaceae bacterium NML160702]